MASQGVPVKYVVLGAVGLLLLFVFVYGNRPEVHINHKAPNDIEELDATKAPAPKQKTTTKHTPKPAAVTASTPVDKPVVAPPVEDTPSSPVDVSMFGDLDKTYHVYFQDAINQEMGRYLASALYDPEVLIQIMKSPGYMRTFDVNNQHAMPEPLSQPYEQIADIKRACSASLGRMHRDTSMEALYKKASHAELIHFDRSVRHFIRGQVRQAVLRIQTIIDFGHARNHAGPMFARRRELFEGHDPMWAFLAAIKATSTSADIKSAWENLGKSPKAASDNNDGLSILHPAEQLFHLEYHRKQYGQQDPHKQKYMYLWRPTASCFELQRECEAPDGCRYYCNFAYLQNAKEQSLDGKPFHHRLLGFGGNNDYDWELSMVKNFGYEKTAVHNKVYSMTTFDCTLKQWTPPEELKSKPIGWGGASFCVGDRTGNIGGRNFVAFNEMKQRILESESTGKHPTVLRNLMAADAPVPVNTENFDEVSVLKCDIEGSEVPVMYTWVDGETKSFNNNKDLQSQIEASQKDGTFLMIDFAKIIPEFFTVSTVLMEIHGISGNPMGEVGTFRTQHLLQQLTQMGYVMVSMEKNFFGDLAYEFNFVHYRYFVRSEIWSHLKGRKDIKRKE